MPKDEYLHMLCRTRPEYRKLWDDRASGGAIEPTIQPEQGAMRGPGVQLKFIFQELGFEACGICGEWICKMEQWGPDGCREHASEIIARLREAADKLSWGERFKLLGRTVSTGWVVKVNWLDPLPSLLNEAIQRAERELERTKA